jgi:hypothetical protein
VLLARLQKLYIADTGMGREIKVFDVDGKALRNGKRHAQLVIPAPARRRPPTACAAMPTATSGRARARVCS